MGATGVAAWSAATAWNSASSYVVGPPASVVTYSGGTYVALVDNVNTTPVAGQTFLGGNVLSVGGVTLTFNAPTLSVGATTTSYTFTWTYTGTPAAQIRFRSVVNGSPFGSGSNNVSLQTMTVTAIPNNATSVAIYLGFNNPADTAPYVLWGPNTYWRQLAAPGATGPSGPALHNFVLMGA